MNRRSRASVYAPVVIPSSVDTQCSVQCIQQRVYTAACVYSSVCIQCSVIQCSIHSVCQVHINRTSVITIDGRRGGGGNEEERNEGEEGRGDTIWCE